MPWLSFDPLIPPSLWLTLALAGLALLAGYALRRPASVSSRRWLAILLMMGSALAFVLLILLNPTWIQPVPAPPGKPLLTILLDASASMATPDVAGPQTRHQSARTLADRLARALDRQFDVRIRSFSSTVSPLTPQELASTRSDGATTDLAAALSASLDQDRPQGQALVLLSDGIHNAAGGTSQVLDAVRLARAAAAPVYTRTFGGQTVASDVALELRSPQDLAFIKQKIPLTVRVKAQGATGAATDILLTQAGKELARRSVNLLPNESADLHFMVGHDAPGLFAYTVRAQPLPGETSQANNTASYLLRVVNEPIRVLVIEGKPYWDSKFLLRTLSSDPAVALDSIVRMTDDRLLRRTLSRASSTQPAGLESWKILNDPAQALGSLDALRAYQIIVLGRNSEAFLTDSAVANLQTWIAQDGGSLVCYRGAPTSQVDQKLSRLLPVKWVPGREVRFHVELTDQGRDLRWLPESSNNADVLSTLPALASAAQVDQSKPLAVVLATSVAADGKHVPVVVYQPYGAGRVVVLEGAGMWRWAFLPPEHQQQNVYASLWHSLLRWLISGVNLLPGQKMTLRSDKVTFHAGQSASATLLVREDPSGAQLPKVELLPEGAAQGQPFAPVPIGDEPGSYRVDFGKLPEGRYQARVAGAPDTDASLRTLFEVKTFGDEHLNLQARPDLMSRIASDSGGAVLDEAAPRQIAEHFQAHLAKTRPQQVRQTTAWDNWPVLALVFGLWTTTWVLRRSGGLI